MYIYVYVTYTCICTYILYIYVRNDVQEHCKYLARKGPFSKQICKILTRLGLQETCKNLHVIFSGYINCS